MSKRQFCRKGAHGCIPAVTLTFDGGKRQLHWCAEHAADADAYRASADPQGTYQGRTADEWRGMARASRQRAADSWERCDTDGFMSQWASGLTAREYDTCAELAERGGWHEFQALFDVNGNLMDAEIRDGQYGMYWLVKGLPAGVKPFFTESKARSGKRRYANDSAKGFRLGTVRRKGYVKLAGALATSVSVVIVPDRYSDEVEIVDNGTGRTWYQDE